MKWLAMAAMAVAAQGCFPDFENPHLGPRGLTEEDLNAPPGKTEIKAAIINDVRHRRALHLSLEDGRKATPAELKLDKYRVQATRAKDEFPLWRVSIREDAPERLNSVMEIAYWDNEQNVYFYHYEGGNPHRDVWMGPFALKFAKRPADDDGHGH